MDFNDIRLIKTCAACPEQYDAFDSDGKQIAYLRMRHGSFTIECPDAGGELVYSVCPNGDGMFDDDEREGYLSDAKKVIVSYYNRKMTEEKIVVRFDSRIPTFDMVITVPPDRDSEEYIDALLDTIFAEKLRYNYTWDFK